MPTVANRIFSNNLEGSNNLNQALKNSQAGPTKNLFITLSIFISHVSTPCSAKSIFCWSLYLYADVKSDNSKSKVKVMKHGRKRSKHGNLVNLFSNLFTEFWIVCLFEIQLSLSESQIISSEMKIIVIKH